MAIGERDDSIARNKRKFLAAEASSLAVSSSDRLQSSIDCAEEENEEEEDGSMLPGWNDPIASQLEELLIRELTEGFQTAIRKIMDLNYTKEMAEFAVLKSGFSYAGGKDFIAEIIESATIYLKKGKKASGSMEFDNLENMAEYILLEMINVLTEVKPSTSISEAMWLLLIFDLNLTNACSTSDSHNSNFTNVSQVSKPSIPHEEDISVGCKNCRMCLQKVAVSSKSSSFGVSGEIDVKLSCGRRSQSGNHSKRDILRQKLHVEKGNKGHTSKVAIRAKITTLVCERKPKSSSESSISSMKNSSMRLKTALSKKVSRYNNNTNTNKSLETNLMAENVDKAVVDYYAGIPYDESSKRYSPQNPRDEVVITLVPHLQSLQKDIKGWSEWAMEKVMQATWRLSKDSSELKALRQERDDTDKFTKDKQSLEDNTVKRLSEMENALANASGQVDMASTTVRRLEENNSDLRKELELKRKEAQEAADKLEEALLKEQVLQKKIQSWPKEKCFLVEEKDEGLSKVSEMKQKVEKVKSICNRFEVLYKEEQKAKEMRLKQAKTVRKEKESLEAWGLEEEERIKRRAEDGLQKHKSVIKDLERRISEMKFESECSELAALRRSGFGTFTGGGDGDGAPFQSGGSSSDKKRLEVFRGNFAENIKKETEEEEEGEGRECVMCLTYEMEVVFLPCAHQVLCRYCNELHKTGMNFCPSCRADIEGRILVKYV
ncbi:putative E3 ubiquitin-protein ligase RF298 [Impatiens glandulifera]|uniref:putative E3 ubiquitin-protein ligase RF298 n=1 Tax=Impatiens glandulifera TaxID=253017 RepID=UPI001FB08410|nr:putative E3 ubiquitin-protein ligase RF298 [Impatiens glandulifera]XP_047327917.1 putative E3 ubiquitin-protein ligase RF298 [Impatiens glandulifera]